MRRLEELLRQMVQASKSIGNTELENKFSEAIKLIKRDIIFAASLYLWKCTRWHAQTQSNKNAFFLWIGPIIWLRREWPILLSVVCYDICCVCVPSSKENKGNYKLSHSRPTVLARLSLTVHIESFKRNYDRYFLLGLLPAVQNRFEHRGKKWQNVVNLKLMVYWFKSVYSGR